jgi:hypothetical protein
MTDHSRWQTLAASGLDFELRADDAAALADHQAGCADCRSVSAGLRADAQALRSIDFGPTPARLRVHVAEKGVAMGRDGPSLGTLLIAAVLLLIATLAGTAAVGALLNQRPSVPDLEGNHVHWKTEVVDLEAGDFWIAVSDQRFIGATGMSVRSDRGTGASWTLELTWQEHGREMRLNMYFASDSRDWWIREVRTYDGNARGEWVYYVAPQFRAPVGQAFDGELSLQMARADTPTVRAATLNFGAVRIAVSPRQADGPPVGVRTPAAGDPPVDGSIEPVSLSNPSREAFAAIESCFVRQHADRVVGMGHLPAAADAVKYAPLDGGLSLPGGAWMVIFDGPVTIGDSVMDSPVCLAWDNGGPVMQTLGKPSGGPEPILALPPLQP